MKNKKVKLLKNLEQNNCAILYIFQFEHFKANEF